MIYDSSLGTVVAARGRGGEGYRMNNAILGEEYDEQCRTNF